VREKLDRNALSDAAQLKTEIKSHIVRILNASDGSKRLQPAVVAVRPTAKARASSSSSASTAPARTTSIGKLANRLRKEGSSVILCAADTFRAAAVEQALRFGRNATASK